MRYYILTYSMLAARPTTNQNRMDRPHLVYTKQEVPPPLKRIDVIGGFGQLPAKAASDWTKSVPQSTAV